MCSNAENGKTIVDIEDAARTAPKRHIWKDLSLPELDREPIQRFLYDLQDGLRALEDPKKLVQRLQRKHKRTLKPSHFTIVYMELVVQGRMEKMKALEDLLITARCRGLSGVTVVTIFLSPYPNGQTFSCAWNCAYCPNEPGQPRSYVFEEPGVLRANQNGFDCVKQMRARIEAYRVNGHPLDKFEILILGGTIASYPKSYLETYMRDMYYAANTCEEDESSIRSPLSLEEEKAINSASQHRVIGVTVETRPDCIKGEELHDFRRWGVTRVQLGVQHTDDAILRRVNRGHGLKATEAAMKLLKDNCFKVDIHLMPNLPGATPEKDKAMFDYVLEKLHPDQVKVYPCTTMPFTKILEEYKAGTYVPYGNDELTDVILYWKDRVHPWIRNNRIVRDIPDSYIVAGVKTSSQRMEFQKLHKERGGICRCIRCREAGRFPNADPAQGKLVVRRYEAQMGKEIFLSWESKDESVLFGFLRLRLPTEKPLFPELQDCALIRELHVYGRTFAVGTTAATAGVGTVGVAQHKGIGKMLLKEGERLAYDAGYKKTAVISGVGVRQYYESQGYSLDGKGEFMVKKIYMKSDLVFFAATHVLGTLYMRLCRNIPYNNTSMTLLLLGLLGLLLALTQIRLYVRAETL